MSYFGSIYFNMPNGLVAGLKNVLDDGKIEKKANLQFDRQAELSFVPIKNIKKISVACDNYTNINDYENDKCDDIYYKDVNGYMQPKRNATIIETYDNKTYRWDSSDSYSQPKEISFYSDLKKVVVSHRTSNVYNGVFYILKNGRMYIDGEGYFGSNEFTDKYTLTNFYNVENAFITRDCIFIIFKNGSAKVFTRNNDCGQAGVGNKITNTGFLQTNGWQDIKINTKNLIDICDYIQIDDYTNDKNLLQGKATTLFIYKNGYIMGCGANFTTIDKDGKEVKCFTNNLADDCSVELQKTNLENVKKIQNEIILYNNQKTNNKEVNNICSNFVKDFYSYTSPKARGIYCLNKYGSLKCVYYGDTTRMLNYYTNKRDTIKEIKDNCIIIDFNNFYNVRNWTLRDNNKTKFKMELYKNANEYLCDIPNEYIEKIEYKSGLDINTFDLTVPKYVNGGVKENPLYTLIKSRQQVVITDINNIKSRYILKEGQGSFTKINGTKTFKAYSVEKVIMNNKVSTQEDYYSLGESDDIETKGIINNIVKDTIYDVGCIDVEASNKKFLAYHTTSKELFKPSDIYSTTRKTNLYCVKEDVKYGDTLYDFYDSQIQTPDEQCVIKSYTIKQKKEGNNFYLDITYNNVTCGDLYYTSENNYHTENEVNYGNLNFKIKVYPNKTIERIEAIATNDIGKRNCIKHIIHYDGTQKTTEQTDSFIKCALETDITSYTRYITFDNVVISYTNEEKTIRKDTITYKFEEKEESIDSLLTEVSDNFVTTIEFDTMNNFIHCFDGELKNLKNEIGFTLGKAKVGDMALGGINSYNVSKTIGKINSSNNIELTYDDITKIESKDDDENILSGMKITGKDDVNINNYNPLGGNIIENWDYFIDNNLLSKDCENHLIKYNVILESKETEWKEIKNNYSEILINIMKLKQLLNIYEVRIQESQVILNNILTNDCDDNKEKIEMYDNQIKNINTEYNNYKTQLEEENDKLTKIEEQISDFANNVNKESIVDENGDKIFTYSDIQELAYFTNIEDISDNYFTDGEQLYEYYKNLLAYKIKGTVEFTTTTNNMMRYYMFGGNLIRLGGIYELDDDLANVFGTNRVKLLSYNYYPNKYEDGSIEDLVFSNKETIVDKVKTFRKNTQIATQNNTKAIQEINNKIQNINSELTKKQNIDYYSKNDELNNKLILGNLSEEYYGEGFLFGKDHGGSESLEKYIRDNTNIKLDENNKKVLYISRGRGGGISSKGKTYATTLAEDFEWYSDEDIEILRDRVIENILGITATTEIPLDKEYEYIPMVEAYIEDEEGQLIKLPYTKTDSNNFVGSRPVSIYINYAVKKDKIIFTYEWNRGNGEPIPSTNYNIKYFVFNYGGEKNI